MEYVYLGIQKEVRNKIRAIKGAATYSEYITSLMKVQEK